MNTWSNYVTARSIAEALAALAAGPAPARPIAGGTDLLLELQQGRQTPIHTLVDISAIPELRCLEIRDRMLQIGAAVPVSDLTKSSLVSEHARALAEACALIGGPQVRNTATLGGNVAHGLPAADGMIALVALDTQVEIASQQGLRMEPILNLFRGPGLTALQLDRELIVKFLIPLKKAGQASAFGRVMRPQGVALPILNLAVWLERSGERINRTRIAVGPAGPVPLRACLVEEFLAGAEFTPRTVAQAREIMQGALPFRTSAMRATAAYRRQLSEVLLEDLLGTAWNRAMREEVV